MIHVGNEITYSNNVPKENYLERISFHTGKPAIYLKHDIINADLEMQAIIDAGVEVFYGHLTYRKSIIHLFKAGIRLRKIVREEKCSIVHVMWGSTTALMATLFSPVPVVVTYCGSELIGNVDKKGKITIVGVFNRFFSQIAGLLASRIITKSEDMNKRLWSISKAKATAIPNGLNLKNFYPMNVENCRDVLGWDVDKKYLLFFDGSGAIVKDRILAEEVFKIVKKEFPNTELEIMVGKNYDVLPIYYNAANVMLLTSFHEGSNNSLKEARACNLPVVSCNVGDAQERLSNVDNSFVTKTRDPNEIAKFVIYILNNNFRSNGYLLSSEVSLETIAKKEIEVYNSIFNL